MVIEMDRLDQMVREAEQTQEGEIQKLESTEKMEIIGVQLNKASRMTTIYHKLDGDPRELPYLAAVFALKKRYNIPGDPRHKQFVFSATPTVPYHEGTTKCMLHPDNPNRELYDSWGLLTCHTATLASPGALVRYMQKRHHDEYDIIKDHEAEQKRLTEVQTSQAMTESMMQAIRTLAGEKPAEEAPPVVEPQAAEEIVVTPTNHPHNFPKAMGSKCRVVNCDVVRTTEYKSRAKT